MTEKQMCTYFWIEKEVEILERQLKELNRQYNGGRKTGAVLPETGLKDSVSERFLSVKKMLEDRLEELYTIRIQIETYINGLEDTELRLIDRMRCISKKSWEEIGFELAMDRRTVSRRFYKQFSA